MSVESDLRMALLAASGVSAAIGTRMYEAGYPERGTRPLVTFQRISTVPIYTHDGRGDLAWSRFQFSVWAETPETARTVASLLVAALPTFDLTEDATSPPTVYTVSPNKLLNRWSDSFAETEPILYRVGLDFEVWHRE